MHTYVHALKLNWIYGCCYVCMHTRATAAKIKSQRTAGSKKPGEEGAQRPRAALNYCYTTVGPKRHQGHRRTRGGIRRDTKGTGTHTGDPRDTKRTAGGHSGGIERDTKRIGGNNGGIGAGRKATRIQPATCNGHSPTDKSVCSGVTIIVYVFN
jgi:hypothetical protein